MVPKKQTGTPNCNMSETGRSRRRPESEFSGGTVLLVVCLFENNFGDLLIYETVARRLRDAGFQTVTAEISKQLAVSKLIEQANQCDFLFFVGGGVIERSAPEVIRHFDVLHHQLQVPYGVVGLGTGEFDYTVFGDALKAFAERAAFFYTRDKESVRPFETAGVTRLPVASVDVVFANNTLLHLNRFGDAIQASFRNVPYVDITGDIDWTTWSKALRRIGVTSLIRDCHNAQEQLGIPISNASILRQIAESRVIIAMRYHIILLASMMGVLTIPVVYCPKVKRLARQLGIEDYCLGLHDHDKLELAFQQLEANASALRRMIDTRVVDLRIQAEILMQDSVRIVQQKVQEKYANTHGR